MVSLKGEKGNNKRVNIVNNFVWFEMLTKAHAMKLPLRES